MTIKKKKNNRRGKREEREEEEKRRERNVQIPPWSKNQLWSLLLFFSSVVGGFVGEPSVHTLNPATYMLSRRKRVEEGGRGRGKGERKKRGRTRKMGT